MFPNSEVRQISAPGARLHVRIVGEGEPVMLLHGYPQTHAMWAPLVQLLGSGYRFVMPDLRGYGDSVALADDFTFRAMANDVVAVANELGIDRFHLVSHDRGSRVAHRFALDFPEKLVSVALLDILPTLNVWRNMDDRRLALAYFHWTFLARPDGLPQRLIGADREYFLRTTLEGLAGGLDMFDPRALTEYVEAARKPSVVHAWCKDYAAAATTDLEHDESDLGRTLDIPALVLWGDKGVVNHFDPLTAWRRWFPQVTGQGVPAGHFLVEERPDLVSPLIAQHLAAAAVTE